MTKDPLLQPEFFLYTSSQGSTRGINGDGILGINIMAKYLKERKITFYDTVRI